MEEKDLQKGVRLKTQQSKGDISAPVPGQSTPSDSTETSVRCRRCGLEQPATNVCGGCHSFLPGNESALVHGGRRQQLGRGTALDESLRVEIRNAVLEDLGGEDEVSEVMRQLVEDFAGAVVLRDLVFAHLAATGPLTKAGRRRASVDLYLSASSRAERLAKQIGTARKPARVPTLQEYLQERAIDQPEVAEDAGGSKVTA